MKCPACGSNKQIVDQRAPIGGSWIDDDGVEHPRIRCADCQKPLVMSQLQPSRQPKPRRATLQAYDREEHQDDPGGPPLLR